MTNSTVYNFFFADPSRIIIMIFILISTVLSVTVLAITISIRRKNKSKFKLVYIIMINIMITAVLCPAGYVLNWVDSYNNNLLFGNGDGFFCQAQAFTTSYFQSCREIFVTLISIISFISFKFGDIINIDESKLSLVLVLLIGYLIPLIECMTFLLKKGYGKSHLYCYTKIEGDEVKFSELCGTIHFSFVVVLIIISTFFIIYLIIKTSSCKKEDKKSDSWIKDDNTKKYCINPNLKKIIFFPIAQIITMSLPVVYRFKSFISHDHSGADAIAGPAAVVNSVSSILYILVFAISNEIFTTFRKEELEGSDSFDDLIELGEK